MTEHVAQEHLQVEVLALVPALRSFARRFYPNASDIDDLVQETLLRAFANLDKFRPGTSLKSWMFTIMRNTFCTRYGQGKREFVGIEDCASLNRAIDAPQEWSIRAQEFHRALVSLPAHYRDAFETVLMRGESYEEAASRCDCPIGTIKSRVNRARSAILKSLGEDGVDGTMGIH